ncbi:MAG: YkgJ family cysteine cluster protein [Candidatus Asgardarchaeia archaeon]
MLLPWRMVKTWKCLMCGECCKKYIVPLTESEVRTFTLLFGKEVIDFSRKKPTLRRINGKCIFLRNGKCSIQDYKPKACKLWPFIVYRKPLRVEDKALAEFEFLGETFYVYIDSECYGINKGTTSVEEIIPEILSIKLGLTNTQVLTTGTRRTPIRIEKIMYNY